MSHFTPCICIRVIDSEVLKCTHIVTFLLNNSNFIWKSSTSMEDNPMDEIFDSLSNLPYERQVEFCSFFFIFFLSICFDNFLVKSILSYIASTLIQTRISTFYHAFHGHLFSILPLSMIVFFTSTLGMRMQQTVCQRARR